MKEKVLMVLKKNVQLINACFLNLKIAVEMSSLGMAS